MYEWKINSRNAYIHALMKQIGSLVFKENTSSCLYRENYMSHWILTVLLKNRFQNFEPHGMTFVFAITLLKEVHFMCYGIFNK